MYTRIKKNTEFTKVFTRGKKIFSPTLIILYLPAKSISLGVCVSKKHGKSVQRNRIKRLLREVFRKYCANIGGSYAFILLPKQAENHSFAAFEKSFVGAVKREGLWKE